MSSFHEEDALCEHADESQDEPQGDTAGGQVAESPKGGTGGKSKGKGKGRGRGRGGKGGSANTKPAAGRHLPRQYKGMNWCRGCQLWHTIADFACNQSLCFECKRNRDNLQRIAVRQKQADWFAAAETDDMKLAMMLCNYNERCPVDTDGTRARGKVCCAQLKQVLEASDEVIKDDVGEMMCEPEFIEWSKTAKGGMLDPSAAKLKWGSMLANQQDLKLITDQLGPVKYPTRIRINVKDLVVFRSKIAYRRQLELAEKLEKKADAAKISRMMNSVMTGKELTRMEGVDLSETARNMAANGSGTCGGTDEFMSPFDHGHLANIQDLLPTDQKSEPESENDGDGSVTTPRKKPAASQAGGGGSACGGAGAGSPGNDGGNAGTTGWLDEGLVLRAQRQWRTSVTKLGTDLEALFIF